MLRADRLWDLVERRAVASPDALFAVDADDRTLCFAGFRDAALRCAAGLHTSGVAPATPVSWQLPTTLEALVLSAALSRLGALQNPILPIYREREVGFAVRQSRARLLITPRAFRGFDHAGMAAGIARELENLETLVVNDALPEGDPTRLPPPPSSPEPVPVRWLFYTSGTTADPKGARHTDATPLALGRALVDALELRADDRIALVFPVTHIGGIGWLAAGLLVGAAQIVIPIFDPERSVNVLARHGMTQGTAGTVFHQAYLAAQRAHGSGRLFPNVRAFPGGGAPKPPQLHFELKRELGGAGIVSGYGLTECPIATMNRIRDPDEKLAHTEGRATAGVELCIVTLDGRDAAAGEEGEIRVRGPQLLRGYLDAKLDAEAFDERGFFRTGDLGRLDADGFLTVTGRTKDVIIRKGENLSAREIEDLLYEHPKVTELAVVGLPDPETGERACAVVVCARPGDPLGFDEMTTFLAERSLMKQKIPERLEIVDALPRNPSGKVLKHELRRRFAPGAD